MIPIRNARRFFYKTLKQPRYASSVLKKRLHAYAYYLFRKGRSPYPESITLLLTRRCNLRCVMCGQWGDRGVYKEHAEEYADMELSLQELQSIVDDISSFKPAITLFGGEPLLYPACVDLIAYIKNKGMHCVMITNGSLLGKHAQDLVHSGLDELNVSIDGKAELHDRIRGAAGLYKKITEGLRQIAGLKHNARRKKPLINLQCTINSHNYRSLEQMLEVAEEIKADSLTFHNLIFSDQDTLERQHEFDRVLGSDSSLWNGFVNNPGIEPLLLNAKIKNIRSGSRRVCVDFYPNFSQEEVEEYYLNQNRRPLKASSRCLSPWVAAYIFPDGELRPCLNFGYSFGNLKRESFSLLWNNNHALRFRRLLKKNRIFPACARCTELFRY